MTVRKTEVSRFQAEDDGGNRAIIIEYRVIIESDEITGDRMSRAPIFEIWLETTDGRSVEKIGENTFEIIGIDKVMRRI
jgi:hypothetical protein